MSTPSSPSKILADRFREVFLNGTWIARTNFKDQLDQTTWEQAVTKVEGLNTIAKLTFHCDYYIAGVMQVLEGGTLDIRDKFSFDCDPITNEAEWQARKETLYVNAERFATLVEALTEEQLDAEFVKADYGTYSRNIEAMIEHGYYHLGQVVMLGRMHSI